MAHTHPLVNSATQPLKEQRILIRYLSCPGYGEGLRISVGTDEEINAFLDAMRALG